MIRIEERERKHPLMTMSSIIPFKAIFSGFFARGMRKRLIRGVFPFSFHASIIMETNISLPGLKSISTILNGTNLTFTGVFVLNHLSFCSTNDISSSDKDNREGEARHFYLRVWNPA